MQNAYDFAEKAHRGQYRHYTSEPYITHCLEVAGLVAVAGLKPAAIAIRLLNNAPVKVKMVLGILNA